MLCCAVGMWRELTKLINNLIWSLRKLWNYLTSDIVKCHNIFIELNVLQKIFQRKPENTQLSVMTILIPCHLEKHMRSIIYLYLQLVFFFICFCSISRNFPPLSLPLSAFHPTSVKKSKQIIKFSSSLSRIHYTCIKCQQSKNHLRVDLSQWLDRIQLATQTHRLNSLWSSSSAELCINVRTHRQNFTNHFKQQKCT